MFCNDLLFINSSLVLSNADIGLLPDLTWAAVLARSLSSRSFSWSCPRDRNTVDWNSPKSTPAGQLMTGGGGSSVVMSFSSIFILLMRYTACLITKTTQFGHMSPQRLSQWRCQTLHEGASMRPDEVSGLPDLHVSGVAGGHGLWSDRHRQLLLGQHPRDGPEVCAAQGSENSPPTTAKLHPDMSNVIF